MKGTVSDFDEKLITFPFMKYFTIMGVNRDYYEEIDRYKEAIFAANCHCWLHYNSSGLAFPGDSN